MSSTNPALRARSAFARRLAHGTGLVGLVALLPLASAADAAETPSVVATIKPIHALAAGVMEGVATPYLLLEGAASPHSYSLKPSEARRIDDADLILWVGDALETFMQRPIDSLGGDARVLALSSVPGLELLRHREGGDFEAQEQESDAAQADSHEVHAHGADAKAEHAHTEHDHDDHAHDDGHGHDEHGHDGRAGAHGHDHEHADGGDPYEAGGHGDGDHAHAHGEHDMHLWLSPENARAMVAAIAEALAELDPDHAEAYAANARRMGEEIAALEDEIGERLAPLRDRPFIVFHDAYQYFEDAFGLEAAGSVTLSPEASPGAARIAEIQARVRQADVVCVFAEPQFEPRLIEVVSEGVDVRLGVLDPLGAEIPAGADAYGALLRNLAQGFEDCLA